MCMGVIAGAYILTLFAVCLLQWYYKLGGMWLNFTNNAHISQIKHKERILGLILVSPLCRAPSWTEWFYNKVSFYIFYLPLCCEKKIHCMKEDILVNIGHVQFTILLWDVWCSGRVSATPLLQQGTLHAFPSVFTERFWLCNGLNTRVISNGSGSSWICRCSRIRYSSSMQKGKCLHCISIWSIV